MKSLNKTVAKFTLKGKKYEVDQLLDSKWGGEAGTPRYAYDIFEGDEHITQFDAYEGADYVKLAKEALMLVYQNTEH
jgi:hypothetical protein